MRMVVCLVAVLFCGLLAFAGDDRDVFRELDAKITKNLARNQWSPDSVAFVRALWKDYQSAHINPDLSGNVSSVFGRMPNPPNPDAYLGSFKNASPGVPVTHGGIKYAPPPLSLRVFKESKDAWFVEIEGHRIPAVFRNKTLYFTTGDVVFSHKPALAAKPYCDLEMFMIIQVDGKLYFSGIATPPERWMELSRSDSPTPKP